MMASTRGKSALVIGIDFVNGYTGVSWLFFKEKMPARDPEVVAHWFSSLPKNNDRTKVPSKIHYDKETGEIKWGYNIPTNVQPIEWFKLLLLEEEDLPANLQDSSHIQRAREMMEEMGMTAIELVGDYLKLLWEHVISVIKAEQGRRLVLGTRFHVVLSIPAIWKDYARDRMRQAAERAGFFRSRLAGKTTLDFVSEPEAAAIATLPSLDNRGDLTIGDSFVVMDAGGGTVDIISYKIDSLEPIVVSECVEGDGALCGATFVDNAFENLLEQRVGRQAWRHMDSSDIKKMMNNEKQWEHGIKKDFDGSQELYRIDIPKKSKRGRVDIKAAEIRQVFEQCLSQIYRLLQKQLDDIKCCTKKPPKFKNQMEILQARGEKPWSAICRGATLSGAVGRRLTEPVMKVHARVSRLSYGWDTMPFFDPNIHDVRDRVWDDTVEDWLAENQVEWVIKRVSQASVPSSAAELMNLQGQNISTIEPKRYHYRQWFKVSEEGIRGCMTKIYFCRSENPPIRVDDTTHDHSTLEYNTSRPVQFMGIERVNRKLVSVWKYNFEVQVSGATLDIRITSQDGEVASSSLIVKTD
ncbi:hypothetical protein FHL15_010842 [Xylaria flabelliformis]|uniref:Hsp70 family chaperone n=1 Tax=Xylaria flabelliformis TaxID=2512241 RepID=A0A553HJZ8_9PEZI|nr:hypothetical protein FHL15_010842 [Xylaria flabelliformis]